MSKGNSVYSEKVIFYYKEGDTESFEFLINNLVKLTEEKKQKRRTEKPGEYKTHSMT